MAESKLKTAGESALAAELREVLGAGPDEEINLILPQFERPAGDPTPIDCPPRDVLEQLHRMSPALLREFGLRPWGQPGVEQDDEDPVEVLWLLPGEWFDALPHGMTFTSIMGREVTTPDDGDIRFGCLAYGVLVPRDGVQQDGGPRG